jgi:hypothetical protein
MAGFLSAMMRTAGETVPDAERFVQRLGNPEEKRVDRCLDRAGVVANNLDVCGRFVTALAGDPIRKTAEYEVVLTGKTPKHVPPIVDDPIWVFSAAVSCW